MKRKMILSACILALTMTGAFAQHMPQSQVPAVVVNSFQQKFPKAKGVDWELKAGLYEAEFEIMEELCAIRKRSPKMICPKG